MSSHYADFVSGATEATIEHLQKIRDLLEMFEPGNQEAFLTFLNLCPSVDISHRQLADLADKSPVTVKRWLEGSKAGKYTQRGLVEDVKAILDSRLDQLKHAA